MHVNESRHIHYFVKCAFGMNILIKGLHKKTIAVAAHILTHTFNFFNCSLNILQNTVALRESHNQYSSFKFKYFSLELVLIFG